MKDQDNRLRIGVLGAGHLGRIHIQQWAEVPGAHVVGFHDPDPARCEAISKEFGVPVLESTDAVIAACDAVDIVTPTLSHHDLAKAGLEQGRHVFIEKPLTHTVAEGEALVALAEKTGLKVQVGHVERFNPAFRAAEPFLSEPMFIETHRLAMFNPRGTDVAVVLDLMIHDLDIVLHAVRSPISSIAASGVSVVSDTPDIANARIAFANGCVANLTASRISMKNMRKSRFFQRDAYISVDMLEKRTEIVRMHDVEGEPDPFAVTIDLGPGRGRRGIAFERPEVKAENAIREELNAFCEAILKDGPVQVPITDGLRALKVAHAVLEEMSKGPMAIA